MNKLYHHGILGMHWGIRRFQNPDGSLTPEGREHYGVGTAAETQKLSYSKDYSVLKQKKNRTEKEDFKLKKLENGKKHFEKSAHDADYWNKLKDNMTSAELFIAQSNYQEYFDSTNYGKGMKKAETLMAIPTGLIGGAVDAGAIYAQFNLGSPIAFYGLATGLGVSIGANIGAKKYGAKHVNKLKEELGSSNKKS